MLKNLALFIVAAYVISACSTSSHILVGQTRAPITADEVQVYTTEPPHYQEIAIIDASSENALVFSEQGMTDAALKYLKAEAAKLGANGVLITSLNDEQTFGPSVGDDDPNVVNYKAIKGLAIYVAPPGSE